LLRSVVILSRWADVGCESFPSFTNFLRPVPYSELVFKTNSANQSSVQAVWSLRQNVLQWGISGKSYEKWMILIIVLFNYFHHFIEISYNWRFVANHMRNVWF
jgi:hypothetical protein